MADNYFAQKQAEADAAHQRTTDAHEAQRRETERLDKEGREHLRDVILPFFEQKAKEVTEAGAYLKLEQDQVRPGTLPSRLMITLAAANRPNVREGNSILIAVAPNLSVTRIYKQRDRHQQARQEDIKIASGSASLVTVEHLDNLYRTMVDHFFGDY